MVARHQPERVVFAAEATTGSEFQRRAEWRRHGRPPIQLEGVLAMSAYRCPECGDYIRHFGNRPTVTVFCRKAGKNVRAILKKLGQIAKRGDK